jgi:hypothetical protein
MLHRDLIWAANGLGIALAVIALIFAWARIS